MGERTTAQTENFEMVTCFRSRQSEQCRREEHCFVVRMGDEKADALVAGSGKRCLRDLRGIQPCCRQDYGNGEGEVELHALLIALRVGTLWIRRHFLT